MRFAERAAYLMLCLVVCSARRGCMGNRMWFGLFVVGPVAGSARGYDESVQGIRSTRGTSLCFSTVWCVEHAAIHL